MNGVDIQDRDSRDYSVSIRSNRWYLRLWFWLLDRVNMSVYIIVTHFAKDNVRTDWKKYCSKHEGRKRFQIELSLALMEKGIRLDWGDELLPENRPKWMRGTELKPCDCNECFFCKAGLTNGIHHDKRHMVVQGENGRKRKVPVQCTKKRVSLPQFKEDQYCGQCYRNQPQHLDSGAKKKLCKKPSMGCPSCSEPICVECWQSYDNECKEDGFYNL
jgi:hypothetical protein